MYQVVDQNFTLIHKVVPQFEVAKLLELTAATVICSYQITIVGWLIHQLSLENPWKCPVSRKLHSNQQTTTPCDIAAKMYPTLVTSE